MQKRKSSSSESDAFEPVPPKVKGDEGSPAPPSNKRNPAGSITVPNTFNYAPVGAGAAAARSSKGGKSGGGMGGQQAGGIKGGGKRKTHAGNK